MATPLDPFIDTDDLQAYLGRPVSGVAGAIIAVDAACDICRTVAEQSFNKVTNEVIYLDGSGTDALVLPERPVTAIKEVTVAGSVVTDYAIKSNGTLVRRYSDPATASTLVWPIGRMNVSVKYDHGFTEVPTDVRMVALTIASRLVIQGVGMKESQGDESIDYAVAATDLTAGELRILRKYRRH